MCYRTRKYTVCRRVHATFSPEILQARGSEGILIFFFFKTNKKLLYQGVTSHQMTNQGSRIYPAESIDQLLLDITARVIRGSLDQNNSKYSSHHSPVIKVGSFQPPRNPAFNFKAGSFQPPQSSAFNFKAGSFQPPQSPAFNFKAGSFQPPQSPTFNFKAGSFQPPQSPTINFKAGSFQPPQSPAFKFYA